MKGNISKELIIETALDMIRNQNNLKGFNLREVARTLGCAHTNLYNYFSSYSDLLWEVYIALLNRSIDGLNEQIASCPDGLSRLNCFFQRFVDTYLDNQGCFRLAWQEYIDAERPEKVSCVIEKTNHVLTQTVCEIWSELSATPSTHELMKRILHDTHCYIIGEVSNYILGRGIIEDKDELKKYITNKAVLIFMLCAKEEG